MKPTDFKNLIAHLRSSGFVFAGSEIYGGLANSWDIGPLGTLLKNNLTNLWIREFVYKQRDVYLLDSKILMNPKVWVASGHVDVFADELIENKITKKRYRADHLISEFDSTINLIKMTSQEREVFVKTHIKEWEGSPCDWSEIRNFNLLFETYQGIVEDKKSQIYLRPETAQGIFINFKNIQRAMRLTVPFAVAQIGKSFRNEVTPGNFIFRTREFEQMEIEHFVHPDHAMEVYDEYLQKITKFLNTLGVKRENWRLKEHAKEELAHYSRKTHDFEYNFPFGWSELLGLAHRGDFDLQTHEKHSGEDLKYFDSATNAKYWPYVIEPSFGVERMMLMLLCDSYEVEKLANDDERIVLRLDKKLSPYKCAILPLVKKLSAETLLVFNALVDQGVAVVYDERGSIGKRYRRQDAIGTPFCLTFDYDSLTDKKVTIRDRDSMEQKRINIADVLGNFKW